MISTHHTGLLKFLQQNIDRINDCKSEERIFGTDVSYLKWKGIIPHPVIFSKEDVIYTPEELIQNNQTVNMALAVLCINSDAFLQTINHTIKFWELFLLGKNTYNANNLFEGIDMVFWHYNKSTHHNQNDSLW